MLLCVSRLIILNAVFSLFQFLQTPMRFVLGALLYRRGTAMGGIGHRREWHLTLVLQVEHSDPVDFYPRDVSRHCNTLSSMRHTCSQKRPYLHLRETALLSRSLFHILLPGSSACQALSIHAGFSSSFLPSFLLSLFLFIFSLDVNSAFGPRT